MPKSKIEWTESTINPTMGCNIVSPGCEHCYAMRQAYRLEKMGQAGYNGLTIKLNSGKIVWTGEINFDISKLKRAVKTKKPTRFFINSMSDLFHHDVTYEFISEAIAIMATHPQHTYQILTKRPQRLLWYCDWQGHKLKELGFDHINGQYFEFPEFIWMGVSVEKQSYADIRIPLLLKTPAKVKWLSCEPLLGPIKIFDVSGWENNSFWWGRKIDINWVVVGCESGPKRRKCKLEWVEDIVNQCKASNIPVFVKQLQINNKVVKDIEMFPENLRIREYPV